MERAAVPTVGLIAEGVGRQGRAEQKNRFSMARAEANEVAAMVELAALYGVFPEGVHGRIRGYYLRTVQMLSALILR